MMRQLMLALIAGLCMSSGWTAGSQGSSKQEAIGLGGGAIIGAAAAGPAGLILGAGLGGFLGDKFHRERSARLESEQRWEQARDEADSLSAVLESSEREIARLDAQLRRELSTHRAALERAFDIQVFFKTAQSTIPNGTEERLGRLGELIAPMQGILVRIEGHADARGNEEYNEQLSAARAAAVRDALVRAGVPPKRITVSAHGERQAAAQASDVDALALERRVHLTLASASETRQVARQ